MANRYYGVDRGGEKKDITEDSSTTSKDVEVVIDLSPGMDRAEALIMLEYIKQYIMEDTWPPA